MLKAEVGSVLHFAQAHPGQLKVMCCLYAPVFLIVSLLTHVSAVCCPLVCTVLEHGLQACVQGHGPIPE